MTYLKLICIGAALAITAIPFVSPAAAQGAEEKFPVPRAGCPETHSKSRRGSDTIYYCYKKPESDKIEERTKSEGPTYTPPTYGFIAKADSYDRCPVGYWTDENARNSCVSPYRDKAPASRLKKGGACAADEVDEWGVYCTSKNTLLTRSEAENTAVADVNIIFAPEGRSANQGYEYENTPGILGIFGPKSGAAPAAVEASDSSSSKKKKRKKEECDNGSATGAAIGGAIGGEGGAVLGGALGGLGKKKGC